jgi:CBS domain-containing protein
MLIKEIVNFLKETPPFNMLEENILGSLAEKISVEFYPRGFKILTQNGPPSTALRIIKKGGLKVYTRNSEGDEIVIDYRSEGDSFGYVSLVSGDRSRADVQAIEDTICYLIPRETLLQLLTDQPLVGEYFMKSFFLNFIGSSYRVLFYLHTRGSRDNVPV